MDNNTEQYSTKRTTTQALEEILCKPIKVLDHGFIRVVDYMGDDAAIVQAARVSYGKGTKKVNEDKGLINYLMRHSHTTPFEMCEIKFHIKLPIFVARQWIRHRTANVNEYSARYSMLDKEFYVPLVENITPQSQTNKQGRNNINISDAESARVLQILNDDASRCYDHYLEMLNLSDDNSSTMEDDVTHIHMQDRKYTERTDIKLRDANRLGIARELARINLTLNYYTQWYWKIDLHNLLHFVKLRADSHAQFEIREYAKEMLNIIKLWVPYTYEAFENHHLNAVKLSANAKSVICRMIAGESVSQQNSGISVREWNELIHSMNLKHLRD